MRKIFIILTIFALNLEVGKCAQRGQVITPKSPVYSDPFLKGPIGSLSQGKKVILSDKTYGNGKSYMLVIGKNIAYIAAKDVVTETYVKDNDQRSQRLIIITLNTSLKKASILAPMMTSPKTIFSFSKGALLTLLVEIGINLMQHLTGEITCRQHLFYFHQTYLLNTITPFLSGLDTLPKKIISQKLVGTFLIGELDFDFIENELFSLSIGLNAYITGELHLKIGLPKKKYTGTLMGSGPKLALNLFPRSKFGIEFLGKYQYYKAVNFDNLEVNGIDKKINLDEFSSFSFSIALKIQFM